MKNEKIIYGFIGLILGGLIVWIFFSSPSISNNMRFVNSNQQGMEIGSNSIDSHFIEQMIPHHEDAITMAKLAQTKAQSSEIKLLSEEIIKAQERENEQMKKWYKEWFGKDVPSGNETMMHHGMMGRDGMHMGIMGDETDIVALENSENFDIEFIVQMIPHHQMAVMMANMLKNSTNRPEMKKLADDVIASQTKEINQMREWLKDWRK